ncbi:NAD-dependent malic enzyme [Biformimicrobium ophioploci]|uniref:NAD-dependent malic enzyme n=1 Tax=Biformimicrobium ophioploci TaxID=3036711 RepID=A0ABQ6LUJ3_9GAMM|nr:NAD-dependent malic enzyme [Microbulbifer sp. NKW57]GMG85757.1 NAD-dependent malic enzyme [Microbulbifer sp. NKW57]
MSAKQNPLYIRYAGPMLLETPLLNKGSAFTEAERLAFNLVGLLPPQIETIEEQVGRAYQQYRQFDDDLNRHIYLRAIQDTNETLFYRLLQDHLTEMMPVIYTPTVGDACEHFSDIYRRHRGLFIPYLQRGHIDEMLHNATKRKVKVIVVTDGERILGLGDQGIGGMGIPIGKLALYCACGGISPAYTLPVVLDAGTNNRKLIEDPMYMGWRHERISADDYKAFVDTFIRACAARWPGVMIQFEDFAQRNALPLLNRYRDELCCFNDDIQGTGAVTLGCIMAACRAAKTRVSDHRVMFVGAGSAGCGVAEQIVAAMCHEGLEDADARSRVFMVDRYGLLCDDMVNLPDFQARLAQPRAAVERWQPGARDISLEQVMDGVKPTIMIGVSGQPGLFTEALVSRMAQYCEQPIIFPLSNPNSRVEGQPADLVAWTGGRALVATGSPFEPVPYDGRRIEISQCNNAYIFPGIGLGVIASGATRVTDNMLMASSVALADCSPLARDGSGALLPSLAEIREVSRYIALKVARQAVEDGVAPDPGSDEALQEGIEQNFWQPVYRSYRRVAY